MASVAQSAQSSRRPSGSTKPRICRATALWDYVANESNELSFNAGDILEVFDNSNKDWWEGKINDQFGYFPSNRVEVMKKDTRSSAAGQLPELAGLAEQFLTPTTANNSSGGPVTASASGEYTYSDSDSNTVGNRLSSLQNAETLPSSPSIAPSRNKISAVLEAKFAAGLLPPSATASNDEGSQGGDSVSTGRASATLARLPTKNSILQTNLTTVSSANGSTTSLYNGPKIESAPVEIIRKEGFISIKQKAEAGGIETKKTNSFDKMWCVLCVGYFLLWKEDPAKTKKPSRPALTIYLNAVEAEPASKDITKKKGAILLTTDDDSQYVIIPQNDSEMNEWIEAICDNSRERSTKAEYENATNKLFPTKEDQVKAALERQSTITAPTATLTRENTATSGGASQLFRRGTTTRSSYSDDPDKKNKMKSKLSAFLFKRPTADTLKEKGIIREDVLIFGGPITADVDQDTGIPRVVRLCIEEVERRGVESQGIYRLSGNASMIQKLKVHINQQESFDITEEDYGSDVVASLLKLYFRELQNPLVPYSDYNNFIAAAKIEDQAQKVTEIKRLVHELPSTNYDTLTYLIKHLINVASKSDINKMEPSNLAIVFGPTLIRMPDEGQSAYLNMMNMTYHNSLVETMINKADEIFDI